MAYKTVLNEADDIIFIEKSKFIGYIKPVETEAEAVAFIEQIKKKHWDATHNVPVYVLGEKYEIQRYSDDGEPSGTAGVPVLDMLKKENITNVCIVMTRYFGGVKLGTGGLVRAYTQTAKIALEAGEVVTKSSYLQFDVGFEYHYHGKILNAISDIDEVIVADTVFTDRVSMNLFVEPCCWESVREKLVELTFGNMDIIEKETKYLTLKNGKVVSTD